MRFAAIVFALVILCVGTASAQTPFIAVYFDAAYTEETADCDPGGFGTLYVAARNWNLFISGVQFNITYPAAIQPLSETWTGQVAFGTTIPPAAQGMAISWAIPQNGFFPVLIGEIFFAWDCSSCVGHEDTAIVVGDHQLLIPPTVGITDWPGFNFIPGVGLTAVICPTTVPTEETTWGKVKALYSE